MAEELVLQVLVFLDRVGETRCPVRHRCGLAVADGGLPGVPRLAVVGLLESHEKREIVEPRGMRLREGLERLPLCGAAALPESLEGAMEQRHLPGAHRAVIDPLQRKRRDLLQG